MSELPNAHEAIVDDGKISQYLLSTTHPAGRSKAAFFMRYGFTPANPVALRDSLMAHANSAPVVTTAATEFGTKYIAEGPLNTPDKRAPLLRTVWFVALGEVAPRLVTAYPVAGESQ